MLPFLLKAEDYAEDLAAFLQEALHDTASHADARLGKTLLRHPVGSTDHIFLGRSRLTKRPMRHPRAAGETRNTCQDFSKGYFAFGVCSLSHLLMFKSQSFQSHVLESGAATVARNFVPAVEFVAYNLENWDERLNSTASHGPRAPDTQTIG